jgi:hypothetical protein
MNLQHSLSAPRAQDYRDFQLKLFAVRCGELAERALAGVIPFIDAVDDAYAAAIWAGVVDNYGDDIVQSVMASAFADARKLSA